MKNTIVLPISHRIINTEHLAAASSSDVPVLKSKPVISKFLWFTFENGYRKVVDPTKVDYQIKLWFVGELGHLYIPYADAQKRDADFKYLMQFAVSE